MANILIIEDDSAMRRSLGRIVESAGHMALLACDGLEGVRTFRAEQPDVVVTDIVMPEQEGIETIIEIRRQKPEARIIAISGARACNGYGGYLRFAQALGADEVLGKPFVAQELLQVIDTLLNRPDCRSMQRSG